MRRRRPSEPLVPLEEVLAARRRFSGGHWLHLERRHRGRLQVTEMGTLRYTNKI